LPSIPAGDNNIGNVDVLTLPAIPAGDNNIGNVDVVTLPAIPTGSNVIGKVDAQNHGWIGAAWQKNPLLLGYSGDTSEVVTNTNADAGLNTLSGAAVPAGEIWVVEAIGVRNVNKASSRSWIYVTTNGNNTYLSDQVAAAAGQFTVWAGAITLSEGDKVQALIYGCDAGDDIKMHYHARRIDIDQ